MREKLTTAEELLARLNEDPTWVTRQREAHERSAALEREFSLLEQPILRDLAAVGLDFSSLGDLSVIANKLPLSSDAVNVALEWLPKAHWRIQESLVRLLAATAEPFDGRILTQLFDDTLRQDADKLPLEHAIALKELRWAIGNTIACAKPRGISEWLYATLRNPHLGQSKEMLLLAAPKILSTKEANDVAISLFDEFPLCCAKALAEVGGEAELGFLEGKVASCGGDDKSEVKHAVRRIRKRLGRK